MRNRDEDLKGKLVSQMFGHATAQRRNVKVINKCRNVTSPQTPLIFTVWIAQWILKCFHSIDCGDLAEKDIPDNLKIILAHDDKLKASLANAWKIIKERHDGPAREFILKNQNHLRNRLIDRNNSILAHGFTPIDVASWNRMETWMESEFIPMLLLESRQVGIRKLVPQLPQTMPA